MNNPSRVKGRATGSNPPNRFESTQLALDNEQLEPGECRAAPGPVSTEFLPDATQSIITENNSPDVSFRYSLNPYRGCEHGCAYCYARPTHELLGLGAGLDFESKVLVKHRAAELLRAELCRPSWRGEVVILSGITDCYQPAERQFGLTRACLEVMLEARQPVAIITKNALVLRDLDLIAELARHRLVVVNLSITTLDAELARRMEPRTSPPEARLRAVRELSGAGVPASVMVAPVIPGLTDCEIPSILEAAREAGARSANYVLLRLPLSVRPVFLDWLAGAYPLKRERIEALIRSTRDGRLNDSQFGRRTRGQGPYAAQIEQTFRVFARKNGLDGGLPDLDSSQFRPPRGPDGQMRLF